MSRFQRQQGSGIETLGYPYLSQKARTAESQKWAIEFRLSLRVRF